MTREEFIEKVVGFENGLLSDDLNVSTKHLGDLLVNLDARLRFFEEERAEQNKAIWETLK